MREGAPGPGLAPSSSVLSMSWVFLRLIWPCPAPQVVRCFWSCWRWSWTLRAAGSRNSAIRDGSRENSLGWDLQSPGRGERDKICIGFNRAKTLCKLGVQKTGLAIAGVGQEWGSRGQGLLWVSQHCRQGLRACSGPPPSPALLHLPKPRDGTGAGPGSPV